MKKIDRISFEKFFIKSMRKCDKSVNKNREVTKMSVTLYSWGAAGEVTGSKHFLNINGKIIQIDSGAFQGHRKETEEKNRNLPYSPSKVSAIVLTHGHFDHCGLLPMMIKNGFDGNIYCTPATRDLVSLVLMDSARIQMRDIEYLKRKAAKKGQRFNQEPLYTEADVVKALSHIITINFHREFYLMDGVSITFYNAGHILGSAQIYMKIKDEERLLKIGFSGDLGRKNLPIIRDPEVMPECDYFVSESTYGDRLHKNITLAVDELAEIINKTYNRGGKIIIPAFAIERTQEIIYFMHLLLQENKIKSMPIYVDSPMSSNATAIFRVHQECYDQETRELFLDNHTDPFGFDKLTYTSSVEQSKGINNVKEPAIIISSSGMCEAGRILHHLKNNVSNPNNTILVIGYMAEHTLGRRIADRVEKVKIFGEEYPLNAEVKILNEFSAHADYKEITEHISSMDTKMLKKIFLVHGEEKAQKHMKNYLEQNLSLPVELVRIQKKYNL